MRDAPAERCHHGVVGDDTWARLANQFADDSYASVKGHVRTYVLHQQLLEHLPPPPAPVLDVGGGALERRWDDALASFDARTEIGVLGVPGRADTVEELSELLRSRGVEPLRWYGVWLFVDWLEFSGAELDPSDAKQVAAAAAVELEASRRDPYRQLSRVFHLVGRKGPS
jgi:hypothetical protein